MTLTRDDLTLFHQPIADEVLKDGAFTTSLDDLLTRAITTSDNTANDKLMRSVGGPAAVRSMISRKHLGSIRFANGERSMQSRGLRGSPGRRTIRLEWKFFEVRDQLPLKVGEARAFNHYIADPYDGAAPAAVVSALARLKRGELLSPQSTAHLHRGDEPHAYGSRSGSRVGWWTGGRSTTRPARAKSWGNSGGL